MLFPNRHNSYLLGREPEGEAALEILDDDSDKAL